MMEVGISVTKHGLYGALLRLIGFVRIPVFALLMLIFIPLVEAKNLIMADSISPVEPCYIRNTTFQGGEEIVYKLYYNWNFVWMAAGEVVFRVEDLNDKFRMTATGRTYGSYEWFYRVRDDYETIIDKGSMLPTYFSRDVNEGKIHFYDKIVFDQTNRQAVTYHGESSAQTKKTVKQLDGCMHDMMSVLYFARNINYNDFKTGTEFPLKIFLDNESWPLTVKYRGKVNNLKLHGQDGRFNAIRFSPQVIVGNVFDEDSSMSVYVSDDKNRIPLLVESTLSVGSIKAVLKSYKGLRHNLEARVE